MFGVSAGSFFGVGVGRRPFLGGVISSWLAIGAAARVWRSRFAARKVGDKGRQAPCHRLLGRAFARVIETYDVDRLPRHGGHATTVFITMSVDDLRKDLGTAALGFDGEQITAAEARRMAFDADLVPVVLGTDSEVSDLGRTARLAHPIQHRALRLRDQCCQAEDCDAPAAWTEAIT